jgi:hypothetical protein
MSLLEGIWKEVIVTYSEVLSRHLDEGTEQHHEMFQHGLQGPGPKSESTRCATGVVTARRKLPNHIVTRLS